MQPVAYRASLNESCLREVNCHAIPCINELIMHHSRFMHHMCCASCGEFRVLICLSGLLRLDRVPQACRNVRIRSTTSVRLLY